MATEVWFRRRFGPTGHGSSEDCGARARQPSISAYAAVGCDGKIAAKYASALRKVMHAT